MIPTTDSERYRVLEANRVLRGFDKKNRVFQKCRRCCICLESSCARPELCRSEFERWAKNQWTTELLAEHERRRPGEVPPDFGEFLARS